MCLEEENKEERQKNNPSTPPEIALLWTPAKQCCFQAALGNLFIKKHLNVELEPYLMLCFLLLVLFP